MQCQPGQVVEELAPAPKEAAQARTTLVLKLWQRVPRRYRPVPGPEEPAPAQQE